VRVAVLSDIHGNTPALDAVLRDIDREAVGALVVAGDVVSGPDPVGVLRRLRADAHPAYWVRGNADEEGLTAWNGTYEARGDALWDDLARWAAQRVGQSLRDFVSTWPQSITLAVDGLGATRFVHASVRSSTELVLVDSPLARWEAALLGLTEQALVMEHTHMPFARLVDRRWVVNAGSVGMPYGTRGASWAILGPGVELRESHYDVEQACGTLLQMSGEACVEQFIQDHVVAHASDVDALEVFHAAAGDR
jgi:putative phosphoesterase